MAFKKSFLLASLVLAAVLNIQAVYAMDEVDEESGWSVSSVLSSANNRLGQVRELMDELAGISLSKTITPAQSVGECETSFFPELSDPDTLLYIFPLLCEDELALEKLSAVALTCRQGYHLVQGSSLWKPLKKTYFGHLPEEYISMLIQGKEEHNFPMARTLLQQLLTYQLDEMKRLKEILLAEDSDGYSLLDSLDKDFKKTLCKDLERQEYSNLEQHPAANYYHREKILSSINTRLIEAYLKLNDPEIVPHMRKYDIFFWREGITRLPLESIDWIIEYSFLHNDTGINIYLGDNQLRWIPGELFSIKKINTLNLMNNLLCYLPNNIECVKDHLTCLELGNWEPRFGEFAMLNDGSGRRTLGNRFKTIPPVILKLSKLQRLDMKSVELDEFSSDKIYEALPELSSVSVSHNNLPSIPQASFKGRNIEVISLDNPAYGLLTLDRKTWVYRYDMCTLFTLKGVAAPFVFLYRMHSYGRQYL